MGGGHHGKVGRGIESLAGSDEEGEGQGGEGEGGG